MLTLRGLVSLGRSFGRSCFQQKLSEPNAICSAIVNRFFATNRSAKANFPVLKKARGPYVIFSVEKRNEVVSSNPGLQITEVAKIIGGMWKSLSEDEKQVYREKYEKEKEELNKSQEAIVQSLTPEQKAEMLEEKRRKKATRRLKKKRALRKALDRPKPSGTNPFLLFVKSKMLDRGDAPVDMFIKGASDMWKKMAEDDKMVYIDQAKSNSLKYKMELAKWEDKMLTDGSFDALSKSKLALLERRHGKKLAARTVEAAAENVETTGEEAKDLHKTVAQEKAAKTLDLPGEKATQKAGLSDKKSEADSLKTDK